jgi:hypothetical protein
MKIIFTGIALLCSLVVCSQDTQKMTHVDSLVVLINRSDFTVRRDTIKQDLPEIGLSMRTYLTVITNGSELKKYVNNVHATTKRNGETKLLITSNIFYFNGNKLIKVEEFAAEGDKKVETVYYYSDDSPIYFTALSDKSQARAELLLTMAKGMLEKMGFK